MWSMTYRRWFSFIILLFLLPSCCLLLSGCEAIGVAAYKVAGPPPIDAKYTPAKTPMLVIVENYQHQSSSNPHADMLANYLTEDLEAENVAPMVPREKLQELRDSKPVEYPSMSITAIGRATGASQILYVQLTSSSVQPLAGGEGYSGSTTAMVKMVDVITGQTLWPTATSEGYPVSAAAKLGSRNGANPMEVRQKMYLSLTGQIGRLFHKWKPENMSPENYEK